MEERRISLQLRLLNNLIHRLINTADVFKQMRELTGTHGYIIKYLMDHRSEDVFQRDIERTFSIRRSTASGILNLMEKNGLIKRESVQEDARLKKLVLTGKAIDLSNRITEDLESKERLMARGLTKQELDTFFAVLEKIKANLEEQC